MGRKQEQFDDDFLAGDGDGETAQSKARKRDAARAAKSKKALADFESETYYVWKKEPTLNPKKGRKLLRVTTRPSGSITEYVGYEKKMPKGFIKSIEIREQDAKE